MVLLNIFLLESDTETFRYSIFHAFIFFLRHTLPFIGQIFITRI